MKGILYFHQGWTDLINCLSLITYYSPIFESLEVLAKEEAKDMINFYIKDLKNVVGVYHPHKKLDSTDIGMLIDCKEKEFLFFGHHDHNVCRFEGKVCAFAHTQGFFVQTFYSAYDIDPDVRFTHFVFERNLLQEEEEYSSFIKNNGEEYSLTHNVKYPQSENKNFISLDVDGNKELYSQILHKSKNFFDYIKILENAKEMHLQDSSWANFIFILQRKYLLFEKIPITIYLRHAEYREMFPCPPNNWKIIQ